GRTRLFFFFQAEDGIRDFHVTGVQTCALPIFAFWLLGTANGEPEQVAALHGPRLERMLTEAVDTPLRGFVYEAAGTVPEAELAEIGRASCRERVSVTVEGGAWKKKSSRPTGRA